ncbi:MAG: hypothetical protein ACK5HR_04125, partial [Mycoplasmatales bacterium]
MMKNKKIKRIAIPVLAVLLVFSVYYIGQLIYINSTNMYALEAGSVEEAAQLLKETDLTDSGSFETKDFYGEYIPGTSFILTKDGRTYYDQGYYMVYKGNYKVVYCINPLKTAWSVKNIDDLHNYNNHEYSKLTTVQQERVSKIIIASDAVYNETKDTQDLVAGQLLIWEAVGADLNSYSSNVQDNMDAINYQADNLDFSNLAKGGTTGSESDDEFVYYNTSGQDLIGNTEDPVEPVNPTDPDNPAEGVTVNKTSDFDGKEAKNGQEIAYKIEVQNISEETKDITVQDKVSDPSLLVDETQNITINGETSEWTIANLQEGITLNSVASGDTITLEYTATIDLIEDYSGEGIVNTATACISTDICDEDVSSVNNSPNIEIAKEMADESGDGVAEVGEVIDFTIKVFNNGETTNDLTLSDTLSENDINYDLSTPILIDGEDKGYTLSDLNKGIILENIHPGAEVIITFSAPVADSIASETGTVTNTAKVCASKDICSTNTASLPTKGFKVDKIVEDNNGNDVAEAKEELTYKIILTNQGSEATDFTIKDVYETAYLNIDPTQSLSITPDKDVEPEATVQGLVDGLTVKSVQPGETVTISFIAQVKDNVNTIEGYTHITNRAEVCNSDECKSDVATITTDADSPVVGNGDSSIQKEIIDANGNDTAELGEVLTYNIKLTNGTTNAITYTITDKLSDSNIVYNLEENLETISTNTGEFATATSKVSDLQTGVKVTVNAGSTFEFTYQGTVIDPLVDENAAFTSNVVEACFEEGCTNGAGYIDLVTSTNFSINKTVTDLDANNIAEPGDTLEYVIAITNEGNTISNAIVTDTFPTLYTNINDILEDELEVSDDVEISGTSEGAVTVGDLTTGVTIKDIVPGQTVELTFNVQVNDPLNELSEVDRITNIATVCYTTITEEENCNSTSAEITTDGTDPVVTPGNGLGVIKQLTDENDDILSSGENVNSTIQIVNSNTEDKVVTVKDELADKNVNYNLDDDLKIVAGEGEFDGTTKVKVNDLTTSGVQVKIPANSSVTLEYSGQIKEPLADSTAIIVSNTVEVCDGDDSCTNGGAFLPLERMSSFTVNKTSSVNGIETNVAENGDVVHYIIQITNTGNIELTNLKIEDVADDALLPSTTNDLTVTDAVGNTIDTELTIEDIFNGATINSIPINGVVNIEYDLTVLADEATNENDILSNIAIVCENETCDTDSADVTTDIAKPVVDGLSVVKEIKDADNNGIVSKGEELTFNVTIANTSLVSNNVTIIDELADSNVDYDLEQLLSFEPEDLETTPASPTVGDLTSGLTLKVPARSTINISFTANVKSGEEFVATASEITNSIKVSDEAGQVVDGGGHISFNGFNVQKNVAVNGDKTETEAAVGDALTYTYKITNIKNADLTNFTLNDIMDDNIMLVPATQDVVITYDDGSVVTTTPKNPTTADLMNGNIVVTDTLKPAQTISFTIEGEVAATATEANSHLTNIFSVCTPTPTGKSVASEVDGNLCTSDSATITTDATKPVVDGLSVVKEIEDANGDEIAQEDEYLTFKVNITNTKDVAQTVSLTDELNDDNIGYNLSDTLTITPSDTETFPVTATLTDLKGGDVKVVVPAGQTVVLTYQGKVRSPLVVSENSKITNNFTACLNDGQCTNAGGQINLTATAGFSIDKTVAVNGDDTVSTVVDGDNLTYTIKIQNNRNSDIDNVVVTDVIDDGIIVPHQVLAVSTTEGGTPELSSNNTSDLFTEEGITIKQLKVGETVTLTYNAVVNLDSMSSENTHLVNIAKVTAFDPLATKSQSISEAGEIYVADIAAVTTDASKPVVDDMGVVKEIIDENGDGVAQLGEKLTYNITLVNTSDNTKDIKITDSLTEKNVDYDLTQVLNFASETTTVPETATVGDLTTGVTMTVGSGQAITVSFTANTKDELTNIAAKEITNYVEACDTEGSCTNAGGHIALPAGRTFNVTKQVSELSDEDGITTDNIVSGGEELQYVIKITNTNNRDLTNLHIEDIIDDNLIVPNSELAITSTMDDNEDQNNPKGYTTTDLLAGGIEIATLRVGEEITITYNAR